MPHSPENVPHTGLQVMKAVSPDFDYRGVVEDILAGPRETQEDRTRFIVDTPDLLVLAAGYLPDQTEPDETHYHTSVNVLTSLHGDFYMSNPDSEKDTVIEAGATAVLPPLTPHYLRAMPKQPDGMGVLFVVAAPGMPTDHPDYSIPVNTLPPPESRLSVPRTGLRRGGLLVANNARLL